jgi:hypothetical protein
MRAWRVNTDFRSSSSKNKHKATQLIAKYGGIDDAARAGKSLSHAIAISEKAAQHT